MPKKKSPSIVDTDTIRYALNRTAKKSRMGQPVPLNPLRKIGDEYVRELDNQLVPYKPYYEPKG